ncbi:MAG TPA: extracellular solute-binding protein [Aestuariivirgaceae bacterium]|jgi:putative spermidine/putrescine transport system substrate-binding protein|nr:extracellular solute-binding protein [Aestuariivirgaceae bacterium]
MPKAKVFGLSAVTAAAMMAFAMPALAQVKELHVMDAGGQWGDAVAKCIDEPLLKEKGIKVVTETPGGYAKMAAQAKSGVINNVATDGSTSELARMAAEGLLEEIDWGAINPMPMFDEAKNKYGFGSSYYSTIMAWRKGVPAPSNWVEFFDTEKFPGKRALPDYPDYVLPFAAMADGMTPEEISKGIDLDRAFKTLKRVKKDTIWWQAGAQPPQLLKDNEAQYAISWSGRVVGQDGVETSFNQGMLDMSWFMIAKGASEDQKKMLYQWFHEQTIPEKQACVAQYISYPGPSPELEKLLPKDKLNQFPTYSENKKVQWLINGDWWFKNAAEIEKRWNEFKLEQ